MPQLSNRNNRSSNQRRRRPRASKNASDDRSPNLFATVNKHRMSLASVGRPSIPGTLFYSGVSMPPRFETTLVYLEPNLEITPGNTWYSHTYRANSAYDPDSALAGGSVTGFKELAAIYQTYRVLECGYQATFTNASTSIFPMAFGVVFYIGATPVIGAVTAQAAGELPWAKTRLLSSTASLPARISDHITMAQLLGSQEATFADSSASLVTTNPATPANLIVFAYSLNSSSDCDFFQVLKIIYRVSFYEQASTPASMDLDHEVSTEHGSTPRNVPRDSIDPSKLVPMLTRAQEWGHTPPPVQNRPAQVMTAQCCHTPPHGEWCPPPN
jgi:hypothetical protein